MNEISDDDTIKTEESDNPLIEDEKIKIPIRSTLTDKTIVLDMDLTLISAIGDDLPLSKIMKSKYRGDYNKLIQNKVINPIIMVNYAGSGITIQNDIVRRPGVNQFLAFCRMTFKNVILWSAGQAPYVHAVVNNVLDPMGKLFDEVMTYNDVETYTFTPESRHLMKMTSMPVFGSVVSTKPLVKIYDKILGCSSENTVIVDDIACNFLPNPRNGILIPPFNPDLEDLIHCSDKLNSSKLISTISSDLCLYRLIHYLSDQDFLDSQDVKHNDLGFFQERGGCQFNIKRK